MSTPTPPDTQTPTLPSTYTAAPVYLTVTHIHEYLFCPRFTYFEYVLDVPEHEEKRYKVQKGRDVHEERQRVNPSYLRRKLGVVRREFDVRLQSEALHLSGVVDEALWLEDGGIAPFDYKFAEYDGHVYEGLRVQSLLYGLLLQEHFALPVRRGFLCYTRSNYRVVELSFKEEDFAHARRLIDSTLTIIQTGMYPQGTSSSAKCGDCCYRNICIQ